MASRSLSYERPAPPLRELGFTYVWLLVAIAVMAAGLAAIGEVASTAAKREREAELLFVGDQFAQAIAEYYASSPSAPQYPQKLEELLADNRYPNVRRYLRRVYRDPMTGRADWGLVRGPGGGIIGVHSQSLERPLKVANFPKSYESFAGATSYSSWVFASQAGGGPAGREKPATPAVPPAKSGPRTTARRAGPTRPPRRRSRLRNLLALVRRVIPKAPRGHRPAGPNSNCLRSTSYTGCCAGPIRYGRIISLSSCSTMWQCQTNWPTCRLKSHPHPGDFARISDDGVLEARSPIARAVWARSLGRSGSAGQSSLTRRLAIDHLEERPRGCASDGRRRWSYRSPTFRSPRRSGVLRHRVLPTSALSFVQKADQRVGGAEASCRAGPRLAPRRRTPTSCSSRATGRVRVAAGSG